MEMKRLYLYRQTLAVLPVLLIQLMSGIGTGWLPPIIYRLENTMFTPEACVWIAVLHYLTRGTSPFLSVFTVDQLGRGGVFVCCSFIFCVMWMPVWACRSASVHYLVRLVYGAGVGMLESTASIYIGENFAPELRATFSGLSHAFFYFGQIFEFLIASYLSYEHLAIANGVLGFVVLLSTFFLRESAHFLVAQNRTQQAEKNYDYLHDLLYARSRLDYEDIKLYVSELRTSPSAQSTRMYRTKEAVKSMRVVLLISLLSMGSGFSVVTLFAAEAISATKNAWRIIIFFGVCQFLSVSLGTTVLEKFNRRSLFLLSSLALIVLHVATVALYYCQATYSWWFLICTTASACVNTMFILPLATTIRGELLPLNVKAIVSSLSVSLGTVIAFVIEVFLPVADTWGIRVDYVLFAFVTFIMTIYAYFDLPETKGETLVDIQNELKLTDAERTNSTYMEAFSGSRWRVFQRMYGS